MLAEKGGDGFSLRELARRVGVTANASYRHFANKDALLLALAAEGSGACAPPRRPPRRPRTGPGDSWWLAGSAICVSPTPIRRCSG